jgi:hypothetical protein
MKFEIQSPKENVMKEIARVFVPRILFALALSLLISVACSVAMGETPADPPGSDVFTTPREALLREKPSLQTPIVGKLPQGTRLTLTESRGSFLRVEGPGLPAAWIARDVVVIFPAGAGPTRDLVVIGRTFGRNDSNRRLAAAMLLRASERFREAKTPDAEVEVLLGETVESLAASGVTSAKELGLVERPGAPGSGPRGVYDGSAFSRALEILAAEGAAGRATPPALRERAVAGSLRARYPERSASLQALQEGSAAWLQLAQTAEDPDVLRSAADRAGSASLALGRYYLALGKPDELAKLEERVRAAGGRVRTLLPEGPPGVRLLSRAAILRAIRGSGGASFPQEAKMSRGSLEHSVRIEGKLGALQLIVETKAGATRDAQPRKSAIPILPVPGSLKISPDGRSAAWVEVAGPSHLVPVMTSLDRDEPAREIAFLSSGRPMRDRDLAHMLTALSGYSKDGQRLGLSIEAWNDTPGPAPRYSIVSVATGELLYETSKDMKSFERLLQ